MKNNRKSKLILMISLVLSIIILGTGFAAFSKNLKISSRAEFTPDPSSFKVVFSTSQDSVIPGKIQSNITNGVEASSATLINTTISGINITFNEQNKEVSYSFYIKNIGNYDAFLNSVEYLAADGTSSFKKCIAIEGTTQSTIQSTCDRVNITITYPKTTSSTSNLLITNTNSNIDGYKIERDKTLLATLTIKYEGANEANGDFKVEFGDIVFNYNTVD